MADLIKMNKKALGGATMKRGKPCNKKTVKNLLKVGSRRQVCVYGTAEKTSGGLTKKDLIVNKWGRVVSRKKHAMGPKLLKNLMNSKKKIGWVAKKGAFGAKKVTGKALKKHLAKLARTRKNMGKKKGGKKNYNKTKKMKGGEEDGDDKRVFDEETLAELQDINDKFTEENAHNFAMNSDADIPLVRDPKKAEEAERKRREEAAKKAEENNNEEEDEEEDPDSETERKEFFNPRMPEDGDYGQQTLDDEQEGEEEEEEEEEE